MKHWKAACVCAAIALGWAGAGGFAQSAAPAQGGAPTAAAPRQVSPGVPGTGFVVTGRVICGDTQRAARFAQVSLVPASGDEGGGFGGRGRQSSARTDLEGNYSIGNVSPGDYFLVGQMTGYVNQRAAVQAAMNAGTNPATALPGVPEVHVGAGGATGDLVLQRGSVIAGLVQWDDGSPATGIQVSVQPAPTTGAQAASSGQAVTGRPGAFAGFGGFNGAQTDDRGRYRISGLAPGVYVVRASVQAPMPQREGTGYNRTLNLAVYAPDKPRQTDAVAVTLTGGEERDDVAITLGLGALHNVSGTVSSTGATVRSGTVSLTDQTDSSLNRTGLINGDGSFVVPYVPAGNYALRVNASTQAQGGFGRGGFGQVGGTSLQPLQESITVADGDLTGLSLNVTPSPVSP